MIFSASCPCSARHGGARPDRPGAPAAGGRAAGGRGRHRGARQPVPGQGLVPAGDALLRRQLGHHRLVLPRRRAGQDSTPTSSRRRAAAPAAREDLRRRSEADADACNLGYAFRAMHHPRPGAFTAAARGPCGPSTTDVRHRRRARWSPGRCSAGTSATGTCTTSSCSTRCRSGAASTPGELRVVILEAQPIHRRHPGLPARRRRHRAVEAGYVEVEGHGAPPAWLDDDVPCTSPRRLRRPTVTPGPPVDPAPRCEDPVTDAVVVGSGPNGLAAAVTLAQAGRARHRARGARTTIGGGTRTARADPARPAARRLLGRAPDRRRLAVPALAAAGRARPGLAPPRGRPRPPARRRPRGRAGPLARRDLRRARRGRAGLAARLRAAGRAASTTWPTTCSARSLRVPGHPRAAGPVRAAGGAAGHRARPALPHPAGPGPLRRLGRPHLPPAHPARHGVAWA